MKKQLFIVTTILAMLVSYIVPLGSLASASTYLTVQEAIDNNSGTGTVAGYIVGHTTGTNSYDFEAPYSNDYNFAIADSPSEKDASKILPVQLPSTFRAKFGLQTNPGNIGKKVIITGDLTAYYSVPGLKNASAMTFEGEGPEEPKPFEGIEGLEISDIQGEGHTSPYVSENVKAVEGIVTHVVDGSNFYMQDETPDENDKTSEGILVYKPSHNVNVGDAVTVDGQVKEWVLDGYSEKLQTDLAMTEINAKDGNVIITSNANDLPEALVVGEDVIPPTEVIDNDQLGTFDPQEDGIDFYESIEGMLVALNNPTVTGPQKYGEVPVITGEVEGKAYTKEGAPLLTKENQNPERMFLLLDNRDYVAKTGDVFNGTVTGVVSYSYSNFKILVKEASLPELTEREFTSEVTTIEKADDKLTVAGYNIENFAASDTAKRDKLAKSMVENLHSPDIIGLVEVLDESGTTDDGTVVADANYKALSDAIAGFGGPTYAWTEIAPEDKTDGGIPGGNIRVGYLYNPERVTLAEGTKGDATTAVAYENGALTFNPGRIDPTNAAFNDSRKPLAAQFNFNGEDVIVINNHFNSKGGDEPLFGKNQPPTLGSEMQRLEIANIVNNFVADILSKNEEANVVVMGDLNDFEYSAPLQALEGSELTNLVETLPAEERYTYTYQGNAQVLDHMLVSNQLAAGAEYDIVNFNSPYMEEHGRASDHDAYIGQFDLTASSNDDFNLSIMHTNDTHAHVEGYPRLFTAVNDVRAQKENTLLLDAGDVFSGTLYFRQYLGLADLWFMNELGFDAMTLGNHEFDKDSKTLANFIKEMNFPMVSSNVTVTGDADLEPLFKNEIGTPGEGGSVYPAMIKEVDGEKVGIFGLTTPDTAFISNPGENVVFEDAVEKSNATIEMLENEGVNKVIALSHLGYSYDLDLAEVVDGLDIIVGGHSHTVLDEPVVIEKEEPTLIVQAGEYLNLLGLLDVTFNAEGVVTNHSGEVLNLKSYEADADALAKVNEFKAPLEELKSEIVGSTDVVLNGERGDVRRKETNLGNLIADGMVAKANESVKTHIAVQNGGGIRASIDAGDINLGEVLTTMPFGNTLVTLDLTGQEILDALEHSVARVEGTDAPGEFLQVSGIHFKYDVNKPAGERVWFVEVKTDNGFEAIDPDLMYTVATNAFTANGGDGYGMFKAAKEEGRITELFEVDYEVFTSYLEKNSPVSPKVEGRIVQEVESTDFELSIMHTNDTHAHVEGYPRLFTAVNEVRAEKENTLLVDAGDVFSGTLYFRQYLGLADLWFMNELGYDAMTLGNHEFDKDSKTLANFIKEMNFPMVSSNVTVTGDTDLEPIFKNEIGTPGEGGNVYPAMIKEVDGEKVGIFGLTTPDTKFISSPGENVVFENAVEKSNATIQMLQSEGINKIIVLSHLGYSNDLDLAEAVDGIDVIVGGHSHTVLDEPVVIEKEEPTLIVQAGEYLNLLGLLDVTFNAEGVVTNHSGEVLDLKNYEQDADALAKVNEYKAPLEELKREVVGKTDVVLNGERGDVRRKETNLGNLITDGMVAKANESVKTHIALQNGGGIRASIDAGDITLGEVLTTMPFGNNLVTLNLTGQEILDALEHSVSRVEGTDAPGEFLQVSGINFKYDVNKPAGERVWFVEVKTDNGFEAIDPEMMYTVATNAFTANGGDGYTMFKNAKEEGRITELFVVDFEVFTSYLEKNSPVSPEVEGRIVQEEEQPMLTGWVYVDGNWYFYNEDGEMQTGRIEWNGKKYTLNDNGTLKFGGANSNAKWLRPTQEGDMKKGWMKSNGKWFFLSSEGPETPGQKGKKN
ncbi:5'-nucleotidase C-terminal domain-containing protein [Rossellomorea aquimaris]|uniref:5'-nucleotidase C-terminal domain-containing protein n=1 Tax=Rossellomorea aquimaris TaxID=189382 RepID=UPI001E4E583C|nr:5'-nucleotidase C-terminal domain-containing protein [Rossellomorea aquimaris]